ncbi:MAG: capsule assembly Wzi family protein [Muribaculaceae bacterium]|nr:capsule assembly Wzi family protein [Muribaculaceae bacterium]
MKLKILAAICLISLFGSPRAKAEWNDSIRYVGELGVTASAGENTPFWMMNNRHGLSSRTRNNGYLRLGAFHDMDTTRRFTWGAGVDLAVAARFTSTFVVQQLYGEAKYRCLNLLIGSKEMPGFISNSDLATGNLTYAGNARPIPQVRAGIFDYADFWGTKGWFAIKGYIAYGKFTDNRWIKSWVDPNSSYALGTLYHSKAIFFRGGNARKFPLEFEFGLEMATEFGGTAYNTPYGPEVKMPGGIKSFLKALIPMRGSDEAPDGEKLNVEGNMLGSWNFALGWKTDDWSVKAYYQHFYEDHSMLFWDYPWKDGLWGVEARLPKNRWVSEIVYEFLYSKDQSGSVYWDHTPEINEQVSGRDGYYNHYIYNGWQHWGMGIGNPLFISPIYNNDHTMYFYSNRLWAHHLGFKGQPSDEIGYRVLASFQKSWGTYDVPSPEVRSDFSLLAEVNYAPRKLKGWKGELGFGMDTGSLLGHSYGVSLKISKTGWFLGPKNKKK